MDKHAFLTILNEYWKTIPPENFPTYYKFNSLMSVNDNKMVLRKLEEYNTKLGIARYDQTDEGITTICFMATITDLLIGERLAAEVDENGKITGWSFYEREATIFTEDTQK